MNDNQKLVLIFLIFLILTFLIIAIESTLDGLFLDEFCREECFPFEYNFIEMYQNKTCACELGNGKLEIREIK